jgi:hypothetical protein
LNSLAQILRYIIYLNSLTKLTIFVLHNNKNTDMKTIIFHPTNPHSTLAGLLLLLTASCGSYQNSSYYDTDGIYGNTYSRNIETNTQNNQNQ